MDLAAQALDDVYFFVVPVLHVADQVHTVVADITAGTACVITCCNVFYVAQRYRSVHIYDITVPFLTSSFISTYFVFVVRRRKHVMTYGPTRKAHVEFYP